MSSFSAFPTGGLSRIGLAIAAGVAGLVTSAAGETANPVATAYYACAASRWVAAAYYADRVQLILGDGRALTLPQAMSASGARYANADETFVFWNKGDTAFITEGAAGATTYEGCRSPG